MEICYHCKKEIKPTECYAQLSTINVGNKIGMNEHSYYHISCWKLYFDKKVKEKAMTTLKDAQEKVNQFVYENPFIKNLMSSLGNIDKQIQMTVVPVEKSLVIDKLNDIKERDDKNGKGKRKKRKI